MNIEALARKLAPHSLLAQVALESDAKSWGSSLINYIQSKASELGLNDDANQKSIAVVDGEFIIKFPQDEDLKVVLQRQVDGIRWLKSKQHWHVRVSLLNAEAIKHFGEVNNFQMDFTASEAIESLLNTAQANLKGSHSPASTFALREGFGVTLRPYQLAGVEYANRARRTFIADDMGIGKTFQALATVYHNDAFPCLVISPASYKYGWEKEIKRALPNHSVLVCDSKSHIQYSLLWSTYSIFVVNYDLLCSGWDGEDKKNITLSDLALKFKERGIKSIIADESLQIMNDKSQRGMACAQLAEGVELRLALNGTPADHRPSDLIGQLVFLDRLKDFGSAWKFKKQFCDLKQVNIRGKLVWQAKGATDGKRLGESLRSTCMIRRMKKDVLTELPDKTNITLSVDLENRKTYESAEADVVAFVRQLALKDQNYRQTLKHLSIAEQEVAMNAYANSKERKALRGQALTKFNILKKVSSQGKRAQTLEWIQNFQQTGNKLVVFAFFIETQEWLVEQFPGCAKVLGEMHPLKRTEEVTRFQEDPNCNLIVCSLMAASTAITLTAASDMLRVELPWGPGHMKQSEDRLHRDTQKNAVMIYDLIARDSVEEDNFELIDQKRKVGEEIFDGEYNKDENYIEVLMDRLLQKRGIK